MNQPAFQLQPSWRTDSSHMVLSEIFSPEVSVVVWQRNQGFTQVKQQVNQYFSNVFPALGLGIREVFPVSALKEGLSEVLPSDPNEKEQNEGGKQAAIDDIYLLSDMLTCLFNCDSVGLRLAPLASAMCPSFHTDNIPVRLVCTYLGPGTQWLPQEAIRRDPIKPGSASLIYRDEDVQQMNTLDAGLLKGSAWENQEGMAAVHRSCEVDNSQKRVLLTLDPM